MQKVKPKKIPLRMCAGCGEMKPKKELVRVVRAPVREVDGVETGGEVSLDLTGRKPGRGAYVCRNPECLKKAQKARRFSKPRLQWKILPRPSAKRRACSPCATPGLRKS